jgi:hypothetical protein
VTKIDENQANVQSTPRQNDIVFFPKVFVDGCVGKRTNQKVTIG